MNNVMNTIEKNILSSIKDSLLKAKELGEIEYDEIPDFILEVPREKTMEILQLILQCS